MAKVKIRPYPSPTLVLLAYDWDEGAGHEDFLGFAIRRKPGFGDESSSWLPNRLSFDGPAKGRDLPSNTSPIQKFMWWDARIDTKDRGKAFEYTITPVRGTPEQLELDESEAGSISVQVPTEVENGIGSFFNRAVVSSQAFIREFGSAPTGKKLEKALSWLANGMENVIPDFIEKSPAFDGAIYHLSDTYWIIPAFKKYKRQGAMVYHSTKKDDSNDDIVGELGKKPNLSFVPRTHTNIMHNKFIVRTDGGKPVAVLTGSANFTTKGITSQANVLHTWDSPELAALYQERQELLASDPLPKDIKQQAEWSDPVTVGDAVVRAFFAPEVKDRRLALGRVVKAVKNAKKSVLFCLFSSTDAELREACFEAGDEGKMMFGLINKVSTPKEGAADNASTRATVETYHRSRENRDVYGHNLFRKDRLPTGFWWEIGSLRTKVNATTDDPAEEEGKRQPPEVYIHHKFIVIDAETDDPIVYSGSANMSGNSNYKNDENLLEIRSSTRIARIYLAEFMRLYEHYRARSQFNQGSQKTFSLGKTMKQWAKKYYKSGSPESKTRINMVSG